MACTDSNTAGSSTRIAARIIDQKAPIVDLIRRYPPIAEPIGLIAQYRFDSLNDSGFPGVPLIL